jgi:hypothetical protein
MPALSELEAPTSRKRLGRKFFLPSSGGFIESAHTDVGETFASAARTTLTICSLNPLLFSANSIGNKNWRQVAKMNW